MISDNISDFITRIRNACLVGKVCTYVHFNKANVAILEIMKDNGFISDFQVIEPGNITYAKVGISKKQHLLQYPIIAVNMRYYKSRSAIKYIKRVSKPGKRFYIKNKDVKPVFNKCGFRFISTSKGIMTNSKAKRSGLGGEVLFDII